MNDAQHVSPSDRRFLSKIACRVVGIMGPFNSKTGAVVQLDEIELERWRPNVITLDEERAQQRAQSEESERGRSVAAHAMEGKRLWQQRRDDIVHATVLASLRNDSPAGRREIRLANVGELYATAEDHRARSTFAKKTIKELSAKLAEADMAIAPAEAKHRETQAAVERTRIDVATAESDHANARRDEDAAKSMAELVRCKEKTGAAWLRADAAAVMHERAKAAVNTTAIDDARAQRDEIAGKLAATKLQLVTAELECAAHDFAAKVRSELAPLVAMHDATLVEFAKTGDVRLVGDDHLAVREVQRVLCRALEGE